MKLSHSSSIALIAIVLSAGCTSAPRRAAEAADAQKKREEDAVLARKQEEWKQEALAEIQAIDKAWAGLKAGMTFDQFEKILGAEVVRKIGLKDWVNRVLAMGKNKGYDKIPFVWERHHYRLVFDTFPNESRVVLSSLAKEQPSQ